jgi:hypothetical protein
VRGRVAPCAVVYHPAFAHDDDVVGMQRHANLMQKALLLGVKFLRLRPPGWWPVWPNDQDERSLMPMRSSSAA